MLSHISLINFRNYTQARTVFHPGLNILVGPNGAGKTNMLEAISFLAPGRGLRGASLKEIAPFDWLHTQKPSPLPGWGITARIARQEETHTISTGMDGESVMRLLSEQADNKPRRQIRIDGHEKSSQSVLLEHLSIIWLTPQMDGLLSGGASERRRFLDRLSGLHDPAHIGRTSRYEKALRQRNFLLKEQPHETRWIKSLDKELAKTGVAIAASRNHIIEKLNGAIDQMDTPFPKASLKMEGMVEEALHKHAALDVEKEFLQALEDSLPSDIHAGITSYGPHKSDFNAIHSIKNTEALYCSTGEQKAMLISLIMAHASLAAPDSIILLDEIAAHLDEKKRDMLLSFLTNYGHQVFATGTDRYLFESHAKQAQFYATLNGQIVS